MSSVNGMVEDLHPSKIHDMVEHACRGLAGVSESAVEMNANLQVFDGIKTSDIQEILIRSANDLITLEAPNYQFVAARLLLFALVSRCIMVTQTYVHTSKSMCGTVLSVVCMTRPFSKHTLMMSGIRSNHLLIMTVTICLHMLAYGRL